METKPQRKWEMPASYRFGQHRVGPTQMFLTSSSVARRVRREVANSVVLSVATPLSLLSTCRTGVDPAIWRGTPGSTEICELLRMLLVLSIS